MRKWPLHTLLLFILAPLLAVTYLTFVSAWAFPQLLDAPFHSGHWDALFRDENNLLSSAFISLIIASFISVTASIFGYSISKSLMLTRRRRGLLQLAFYPYLIAPVVFGAMLNYYFLKMGLTGTLSGVIMAQALFIFPYSVLLFSTFWTERIRAIAFQAATLGASAKQVNLRVILPMARPWLILSLVQCFLISWFEYGLTQMIGVGKVKTLTIQAMHFIKEANPHQASIAALVMIVPVLLIFLLGFNLFPKALRV